MEFLQFLATGLGRTLLIMVFFGAIILFLRLLYGPKGIFRDPAWDAAPKNQADTQPETQAENQAENRVKDNLENALKNPPDPFLVTNLEHERDNLKKQ